MIESLELQTADGGVPAIGDVPTTFTPGLAFIKDGIKLAQMLDVDSERAELVIATIYDQPLEPNNCLAIVDFAERLHAVLEPAVDHAGMPIGDAGAWLASFSEIKRTDTDGLAVDSVFGTPVHWIAQGLPALVRFLRFAHSHELRVAISDAWDPWWGQDPLPNHALAMADEPGARFPRAWAMLDAAVVLADLVGIDAGGVRAILTREQVSPDDAAELASFAARIGPEAARRVDGDASSLGDEPAVETARVTPRASIRLSWIAEAFPALAEFLLRAARDGRTLVPADSVGWWWELTPAAREPVRARSRRE